MKKEINIFEGNFEFDEKEGKSLSLELSFFNLSSINSIISKQKASLETIIIAVLFG